MNDVATRLATPPVQPLSRIGRPRLGFLGLGWIGRMRLEALIAAEIAEIAALADLAPAALADAQALAPSARTGMGLEALLDAGLDGIVIATPSARHAREAIRALDHGLAVFCQKPLARTGSEARAILARARGADRLLGVDYSYRFVNGMSAVREAIRAGELGKIFAVDLVFHNAYGPDKPWFYVMDQAGGGCLLDLGTHLLDLLLWCLDYPDVVGLASRLYAKGCPLAKPISQVEDYAELWLDLEGGAHGRLTCSWGLSAGCDVVIQARFYGTAGAAALTNVNGSYFDFVVERMHGTRRKTIAGYPDAWGGRALVDWVRRLGEDARFDPELDRLVLVPSLLDEAYGR